MDPQKIPPILTDKSVLTTYEKIEDALQRAVKDTADKDARKKFETKVKELDVCATTLFGTLMEAMDGFKPEGAALLGRYKPTAYEEAEERIANLKRLFPGGDKWAAQGRPTGKKIADAARQFRDKLNARDLGMPKAVDGKVRELTSMLEKLATEGRNWFEDASADLSSRLTELQSDADRLKKLASNQNNEGSVDQRDKRSTKTRNSLKELRTAPPDRKVPMWVLVKGQELYVYVARDAGSGLKDTLDREIFGGLADRMYPGSVAYRDKRFMFVSSQLNGGAWTARIQKFLQNEIGQRLPLSVSNDKGLLEPPLTGEDFEDPIDFLISERPVLRDRAKRLKTMRTELIKAAENSGVLGREGKDGSYLAVYTGILERFDELVAAEPPKLDEAERMLRRITTDVIQPFEKRRDSAASDQKEYEKEEKAIMDDWAKQIDRERNLLFSEVRAVYGKDRDKAPTDDNEIKAIIEATKTLIPKVTAAVEAAKNAGKGGNYDGEWDKAKTLLYQLDEQRSNWKMARARMVKAAAAAVAGLQDDAKKKEAAKKNA